MSPPAFNIPEAVQLVQPNSGARQRTSYDSPEARIETIPKFARTAPRYTVNAVPWSRNWTTGCHWTMS